MKAEHPLYIKYHNLGMKHYEKFQQLYDEPVASVSLKSHLAKIKYHYKMNSYYAMLAHIANSRRRKPTDLEMAQAKLRAEDYATTYMKENDTYWKDDPYWKNRRNRRLL